MPEGKLVGGLCLSVCHMQQLPSNMRCHSPFPEYIIDWILSTCYRLNVTCSAYFTLFPDTSCQFVLLRDQSPFGL